MDIKLTEEEKEKYDLIYDKITSQYSKEDMALLLEDDIAKHVLKNLIIRYIFTGEFPSDFRVKNIQVNGKTEVHYDASIPLQEKPETQVGDLELITEEQAKINGNEVYLDYGNILSSLKLDRTESDELVKPIQNE